jgi:protein arginine N-methyltransferase 1
LNQLPAVRTRPGTPAPGTVYLCPAVGDYPVYDEAIYHVLAQDKRRNALFAGAVARAVRPGTTVLEIGCGPDLLWTLAAADAGAGRVYAVESIPASARLAAQAAAARGDGSIRVVTGNSTEVELPERAEVCIAEIVGCIGGSEGIAAVLADARERHLTPAAAVIPAAVRTRAAAVSLTDLAGGDITMPAEFAPYVHAVWTAAGGPFDLRLYVGGAGPAALMSTASTFEDLDLTGQSCTQGGDLRLRITRPGRIDGLLAWIELTVGPDDLVLNSLSEDTNWLPVYIPFAQEPLEVGAGDSLDLNVTTRNAADGIHPEYFFAGQLDHVGNAVEVSGESRYSGGPFRATTAHRALFPASSPPGT